MNKLYTAQEVADRLKIKKTTVYELIKRGELESSKIGKQLRVSEEQLSQYLNRSSSGNLGNSGFSRTASGFSGISVSGASANTGFVSGTERNLPYTAANFEPESSLLKRDYLLHSSGIILGGQTSAALELLLGRMSAHPEGLPVLQSHMNDYNGLYALYFEKAHIAATSLDIDDIRHLVPGIPLALLSLYKYSTGFYVQAGNPEKISSVEDLTNPEIVFINREKGSARRVYLDRLLKERLISTEKISGYRNEAVSDVSAASAVFEHRANVAFGEEMIARYFPGLDFVPVTTMHMYLAIPAESVKKPGFSALVEIVQSEDFKTEIQHLTGYDTADTGELIYI